MTIRRLKKEQSVTLSWCALLLATLALLGCQSSRYDRSAIVGVDLINQTKFELKDISVKVVGHGAQVSCNHIELHSQCGTGFPVKYYNHEPLRLTYYQDGEFQSHLFTVKLPRDTQQSYRVSIVIQANKIDVSVLKQMSL